MVYIIIIEIFTRYEKDEILTEIYSNYQEAKLTYNLIVKDLNNDINYRFDNKIINVDDVKSIRLLEREVICQR